MIIHCSKCGNKVLTTVYICYKCGYDNTPGRGTATNLVFRKKTTEELKRDNGYVGVFTEFYPNGLKHLQGM